MKRLVWFFLITLALVACSRKGPAPTNSPTLPDSPVRTSQATSPPPGSPVPRITIVPSATRLQSASPGEPGDVSASPTGAVESPTTSVPSSTLTPRIVDAGATATLTRPPTSTPLDSPLPTPPQQESPPAPPPGTQTPTATPTPPSTPSAASATPTPVVSTEASSTPTFTPTPILPDEGWGIINVFTYYDDAFQEFYISGEVVNDTHFDRRITTLMPVVYDEDELPATSEDDVEFPEGFDELREAVVLPPGQSLSFDFLVYPPEGISVEDNYEILVEGGPAEATRDDLDITSYEFDDFDWPVYFYVDGAFENPGPALTEYVAVVVTLYDEDGRVIGVGWFYETGSSALAAGEHEFEVEVETSYMVYELELEVYTYQVQIFGY